MNAFVVGRWSLRLFAVSRIRVEHSVDEATICPTFVCTSQGFCAAQGYSDTHTMDAIIINKMCMYTEGPQSSNGAVWRVTPSCESDANYNSRSGCTDRCRDGT